MGYRKHPDNEVRRSRYAELRGLQMTPSHARHYRDWSHNHYESIKKQKMFVMIDKAYLDAHPNEVFVFGDNDERRGKAGAASLRDHPQTFGFSTKKRPGMRNEDFYTPEEYRKRFEEEKARLIEHMRQNPDKTYLMSKIGSGLANRNKIYENVIFPELEKLVKEEEQVVLL